jgi:hypothetical protein
VGFIHERGCIHGEFDLYIFLDNNKIAHIDENNTPGKEAQEKLLKNVKGFNRIFACGITA